MTKKEKSIFREQALLHETKQEKATRVQVLSGRSWIFLTSLMLLFALIIIWGFWGKIPIRVFGEGILISSAGAVYQASAPEGSGEVLQLLVHQGDRIKQGQIIAILSAPNLEKAYEVANDHLQSLLKKKAELSGLQQEKLVAYKKNIEAQNQSLQEQLRYEKNYLTQLTSLLKTKQQSFARGIITKEDLMRTVRDYYSSQKEIKSLNDKLQQNQINLSEFIDKWQQRLRDLELRIKQQHESVQEKKKNLQIATVIKSPINGIVNDVQISVGEKLTTAKTVVTLSKLEHHLQGLIFVPADQGKAIKPGMDIRISPTNLKKEEYGSIIGTINSITNFPITSEAMHSLLHNKELESKFLKSGPPVLVRANLIPDLNTPSGYKWTSSKGPDQKITAGTLVRASITTRNLSPVDLIIPRIKSLMTGAEP